MSYDLVTIDDVFLVKWGNIDIADLTPVEQTLQSRCEEVGHDLLFIGVISMKSAVPRSDVRTEIGAALKRIRDKCRDVFIVIEGDGLIAATIRTVNAGISLLSGERMRFASSVEEALRTAEVGLSTRRAVAQSLKKLD